jgi:hypothetical protein
MLKDLHVPLELPSRGEEFGEAEIEAIQQEHLRPVISRTPRGFHLCLDSINKQVFEAKMRRQEPTMEVTNFSVGYKELGGYGLGAKILEAGIEIGRRMNPELDKITTGWEHISVLNAFAKVLGPENVAARAGRENYGHGYDKPLEELIVPGITRVQWIEAVLEPVDERTPSPLSSL